MEKFNIMGGSLKNLSFRGRGFTKKTTCRAELPTNGGFGQSPDLMGEAWQKRAEVF